MFTYILKGKVLPERAAVSISNLCLRVKIPILSNFIDINFSIQVSQISVVVRSEIEINDFETLKNYIQDTTSLILDIYGYLSGRGYDVEITSLTTVEKNEQYVFGVGIDSIEKDQKNRPKSYQEIIEIFKGNIKFEQQLRLALFNFRLAIRSSSDTAFHCYRAVEAIAQCFKISKKDKFKNEDWNNFNNSLNINNGWIMKMKNQHADQQRHGNSTYMSGEERVEMLKNTQLVIDKFIIYITKL